ncbi:hypothetical protein EVAR_100653_1 [Eumeta japonica]|uniref:Uncharacterized protein n=1 Tax=Eumeta variegata TaxID=151549 RepID=A0A4C1SI87_EUMVA|nr:hypothetical protein EVAR_100653_1 [Eumeta japonica]
MYSVSVSKRRRRHSTRDKSTPTETRSRYRSGRLALGKNLPAFGRFIRGALATKIDSCFERAPTAVTGSSGGEIVN